MIKTLKMTLGIAALAASLTTQANPEPTTNLQNFRQSRVQRPNPYCSDPIRDSLSPERERICTLVNVERARYGASPLQLHPRLDRFAQNYANQMATRNFYSHVDPEGNGLVRRLNRFGIPWTRAGENIALGQPSCESVMRAWMNSPGHRRSILNPKFRWLGVGRSGRYWAQTFTN